MPAALRSPDRRPAADRRGTPRHPVQVEGVLRAGAAAHGVVVTDISEQGCRIVRPAGLAGGGAVTLGVGGFAPFEATVVWTSPGAAGLQFDQPVHRALIDRLVSAARARGRGKRVLSPGLVRREERERLWHLRLDVVFEDAAAPAAERRRWAGVLSDLSADGCRIAADVDVPPGTGLLLHIGARAPMLGIVRWCGEAGIGVEFGAPLSPATVEGIARSAE